MNSRPQQNERRVTPVSRAPEPVPETTRGPDTAALAHQPTEPSINSLMRSA